MSAGGTRTSAQWMQPKAPAKPNAPYRTLPVSARPRGSGVRVRPAIAEQHRPPRSRSGASRSRAGRAPRSRRGRRRRSRRRAGRPRRTPGRRGRRESRRRRPRRHRSTGSATLAARMSTGSTDGAEANSSSERSNRAAAARPGHVRGAPGLVREGVEDAVLGGSEADAEERGRGGLVPDDRHDALEERLDVRFLPGLGVEADQQTDGDHGGDAPSAAATCHRSSDRGAAAAWIVSVSRGAAPSGPPPNRSRRRAGQRCRDARRLCAVRAPAAPRPRRHGGARPPRGRLSRVESTGPSPDRSRRRSDRGRRDGQRARRSCARPTG